MERPKDVIFCAIPDLNYIDGSSIWAQTFALALAATGEARVRFIAKSRPERQELFAPVLANPAVDIVDGSAPAHWGGKGLRRLNGQQMAELAIALDRQLPCQVLVVRGLDIARELLAHPGLLARTWLYLTDIPQDAAEYSTELRHLVSNLARGCGLLLCQSQGFVALWQQLVPGLDASKVRIYSPVVPDIPTALPDLATRPLRAVYAGKFKAEWMTLDMARVWPEVNRHVPGSELVMIGDKIHAEPNAPTFQENMRNALGGTRGLRWLGALSREDVQAELRNARVGLSWRAASLDETVEYSTKILEYGGAGCAAILNRNSLHESLLGRDYPLFANTAKEFQSALVLALQNEPVATEAAWRLRDLAERHTFTSRVKELSRWLATFPRIESTTSMRSLPHGNRLTVLVAGHDLKFFRPLRNALESTGRYSFLVDDWEGHNKHDEQRSLALLPRADVIFCEWCLGNLEWYSHRKLPHQRLVARFHAQERLLPYLDRSNHVAIDHIAYVSEAARAKALARCRFPRGRTSVIENMIDECRFKLAKKSGDAQFTLGMIGIVPSSKRLDRALDLLEVLLAKDHRYCLRVKGSLPHQYPWLEKRAGEVEFYRRVFSRINGSDLLRNRVIFDPAGDDVDLWLSFVGYILSPSDAESFHVAVGEGMATGCVPVVWDWDGARTVWPDEFVVSSIEDAARLVESHQFSPVHRKYVLSRYSAVRILPKWCAVIG
jgi:glycosyltransferase involved in cell wall biosynthesis